MNGSKIPEMAPMKKSIYLTPLHTLKEKMRKVRNTPFTIHAKVVTLVTMNIRYERVAFNNKLSEHPYLITKKIIEDAINQFEAIMETAYIESDNKSITKFKELEIEKKHKALWQEIWDRHNKKEFQEFIYLKRFRLEINNLGRYIKGKDCVDFGCGNGAFAFALIELGARSVIGIDFGEKSIKYAKMVAHKRKLAGKARFYVRSVLDSKLPSNHFDFAVSNGVFHHLKFKDIPVAISEVARVLKTSGWFWYYVDGKNAISMDLYDASVDILKGIDLSLIENCLKVMNVRRNKMVHLMDGLNATYLHSTYDDVVKLLSRYKFGNFRRLRGGLKTDFDLDKIEADPYGREKFGEGDLRILCRLTDK